MRVLKFVPNFYSHPIPAKDGVDNAICRCVHNIGITVLGKPSQG